MAGPRLVGIKLRLIRVRALLKAEVRRTRAVRDEEKTCAGIQIGSTLAELY